MAYYNSTVLPKLLLPKTFITYNIADFFFAFKQAFFLSKYLKERKISHQSTNPPQKCEPVFLKDDLHEL